MKMVIRYSFLYFVLVFSAGFVLGSIRVIFLVPNFGEHHSEIMEMPFMVLVCFLAARFVVRVADDKLAATQSIFLGILALVYLLLAEFSFVLWLRDIPLSEYMGSKYSFAGAAYLVSLILYTIFPYIVHSSKKHRLTKRQTGSSNSEIDRLMPFKSEEE